MVGKLGALAVCVVAMARCSFHAQGPRAGAPVSEPPICQPNAPNSIAFDVIGASLFLLPPLVAFDENFGCWSTTESSCPTQPLSERLARAALLSIPSVIYVYSAIVGVRRTRRCRAALSAHFAWQRRQQPFHGPPGSAR